MGDRRVQRVDFGYFIRPAAETGTGLPRVEPCLGYVVTHPGGVLLVDTGMGSEPEVDAHYQPRRVPLGQALGATGTEVGAVTEVVNCHLHFDHCGGNPALAGRPVFTQRMELESAQSAADYTLPELVEAPGLRYEVLDGEAEIVPGIMIVPTPGHTAGHQSVVVRCRDGTVIVAGQSHDTASQYAADVLAHRAAAALRADAAAALRADAAAALRADVGAAEPDGVARQPTAPPPVPAWIDRLTQLDPRRVVFAHDHSVWEP